MPRCKNIKLFKIGPVGTLVTYTTIKEIDVSETTEEITDSGDIDTVDTFIAKGKSACRGSVTLSDGIQATTIKALVPAAGSPHILEAQGEDAADAANMKMTVTGVLFFNKSTRAMHNGVWQHTLTFRAASYAVATFP